MHTLIPSAAAEQVLLGALGPNPTQTASSGYMWFPYLRDASNQYTSCPATNYRAGLAPSDALRVNGAPGCWVHRGFAWGQRPIDAPEITVRQPATTTTRTPTTRELCDFAFNGWLTKEATAAQRTCTMRLGMPAYNAYSAMCAQVLAGRMTSAAGRSQFEQYLAQQCPATPPPRTPPPPRVTQQNPPPPPPRSPPPDWPQDDETPGVTEERDTPPEDVTQPKSVLRQLGPIVGFGLIAAVTLTAMRKKKLTSRRRKK